MIWLLLTVLCAAPVAASVPSDVGEHAAIAFVESVGGRFAHNNAGQLTAIDLRNAWITDADLGKLGHLPNLENINLVLFTVKYNNL